MLVPPGGEAVLGVLQQFREHLRGPRRDILAGQSLSRARLYKGGDSNRRLAIESPVGRRHPRVGRWVAKEHAPGEAVLFDKAEEGVNADSHAFFESLGGILQRLADEAEQLGGLPLEQLDLQLGLGGEMVVDNRRRRSCLGSETPPASPAAACS